LVYTTLFFDKLGLVIFHVLVIFLLAMLLTQSTNLDIIYNGHISHYPSTTSTFSIVIREQNALIYLIPDHIIAGEFSL